MDTSVVAYLFNWRGDLYLQVERVHRSAGRRYAPRDRMATWHAQAPLRLQEDEALEWFVACMTQWLNAGLPKHAWHEREALPASPSGDHRGVRVATGSRPSNALPSIAAEIPSGQSGAVGVSDGLTPPGVTDPLF